MMEKLQLSRKKPMVLLAAALLLLWTSMMPMYAGAAPATGGISMCTDYPGIYGKAWGDHNIQSVFYKQR